MSDFLQMHACLFYPASLPNRDRNGEAKQVIIGNVPRPRINSACLKRNWRTGDVFRREFGKLGEKYLGQRTKENGTLVYQQLIDGGLPEAQAEQWAISLGSVFGPTKPRGKKDTFDHLKNETLFLLSPEERIARDNYVQKILSEKLPPPTATGKELEKEVQKIRSSILSVDSTAIDIAFWGRFFASDKTFNVEAAVQVAHAFGVSPLNLEDDWFCANDDVKNDENGEASDIMEKRGGGHLGTTPLMSDVFYVYTSVNMSQLLERLKDRAIVEWFVKAYIESVVTIYPKAKGNSCAQQSRAFYARVERGPKVPRNLALAYLDPIERKGDVARLAVERLAKMAASMDRIYGKCYDRCAEFNAFTDQGSLDDLLKLGEMT
jgi:CRISPR system Cascade subunit CasC